jgi:small conductance mechanosensitive channel
MHTRMDIVDHIISRRPYLTAEDWITIKHHAFGLVPEILAAIAVLIIGYGFYKVTVAPLRRLLVRSRMEPWLARIVAYNVYKSIVVVIAFVTAASQLGVNVGAALTGIGILGVGIGFVAQDALSNIVAGFLISVDKPFRIGDYITLDKHYGRIEQITMRSTRIRTPDNTYVVIPNHKIINDVVVDHTTNGDTRIVVEVQIAYEASIETARKAILERVAHIEGVLLDPTPDVVAAELASSGVRLLVRVWIANAALERRVFFETTENVKKALDDAGIEIAYPHLKLANKNLILTKG